MTFFEWMNDKYPIPIRLAESLPGVRCAILMRSGLRLPMRILSRIFCSIPCRTK